MKSLVKLSIVAVFLAATMVTGVAQAQQKIGVVDVARVFQQLPQREAISQTLQAEFEDRMEEMRQIETRMQELQDKSQRDASILSQDQLVKMQREMESLQAEAQLKGKALNEDMRNRQNEERNKLLAQMESVIQKIAQDGGYDIILQSNAVAFINEASDVSDEVVAAMAGN